MNDAALLWPESFATGIVESAAGDEASSREQATTQLVQGWLQLLGPTTAAQLAEIMSLHPRSINQALLKMEMQGLAMRGVFERPKPADDQPHEIEWCERRILHRIHRLTVRSMRQRTEPVAATVYMRWLLEWHRLTAAQDEARAAYGRRGCAGCHRAA